VVCVARDEDEPYVADDESGFVTNHARRADRSIEAQSSPAAHQGARVIGADALRIVLISPDPSDGQECNQDNEGNPNINAHQSSPATGSAPRAIGAGQCCRLSKQVELALFFDAKLDLAAP
jgi:hypothetical protein